MKSCLEELSTKINSIIDITDLIQDVITIDPITDFNLELPQNFISMKLVAGKFINVYRNDKLKIELHVCNNLRITCSIVGIKPKNVNDKSNQDYFVNCLPEIYNFDMINDFNIDNKDYIFEINNILGKIKEKLYENY